MGSRSGALHHALGVLDEALAIGVKGDGVGSGGVPQDVVEAGAEGGALTEVEHVAQDRGAGGAGDVRRAVSGPVVDIDTPPKAWRRSETVRATCSPR